MSQLSEHVIARLQGELAKQRLAVLAQIRAHLSAGDDPTQLALANHFSDAAGSACADVLNDTDIALLERELAHLYEIDSAIQRLNYGIGSMCTKCGSHIPVNRLLANPTACTCIDCQTRSERRSGELATHSM
ncbi:MAG: TraR/DksA family transcriptional regulator [Pseudomonadota bacterium]